MKTEVKICKTVGCGKPHKAKGYCRDCYHKFVVSAKEGEKYKEIDGKMVKVATCKVCEKEFIKTGKNKTCSSKCSAIALKKYHKDYYKQEEQNKDIKKVLRAIENKELKTIVKYLLNRLNEVENKEEYSIVSDTLKLLTSKEGNIEILEYLNKYSYNE